MASNESREDFGKIAMLILNNITYFYLKTVLNHLIAVIHLLQGKWLYGNGLSLRVEYAPEKDLPFVMRIIVQSLLEGSPEGLMSKANSLNESIREKFSHLSSESFGLIETCPACQSPIALENIQSATCPRGHTWGNSPYYTSA